MKVTYHIPTEQYGFIEVEVEIKGQERPDSYKTIRELFTEKNAGGDV